MITFLVSVKTMTKTDYENITFDDVARFHGHVCPGLTIGYIAGKAGLEKIESLRDVDEQILVIVENDACGVDAIQVLTGCTLGKGNLIFKDYAKQAFTFVCRESGKAVRLALRADFDSGKLVPEFPAVNEKIINKTATPDDIKKARELKMKISDKMRELPVEDIFNITFVDIEIPEKARLFNSYKCDKCGEMVAESRTRVNNGKYVCIPCNEEYTRGW
ncbi:MAG: formylmethanofuran dehydrogenase [Methanosarcinaceae archaeon]|nr:formylmethanofuran dehydrogenase [Methanosarcinaceae archaeon]